MSDTATVKVQSVSTKQVNGRTIWELTDGNGKVYSTFVPGIGNAALQYEGGPAIVEFTEKTTQKGEKTYTNRYLESVHPAPPPEKGSPEYQPEEVDWDGKELRAHRRAVWAIAASLSQHTGSSDETPKRIYERVKPLQLAILGDIYADFGGALPAAQDTDVDPSLGAGLSAQDDGIPFAPTIH